jgi:hypothetical protein
VNPKIKENITIQEAMDNLAAIAGIDLNAPGPIGILKKNRIVTDEEEFVGPEVQWLSGEGSEAILTILDTTFRALHQHLIHLMESEEMDWDDEKSLRAVASMMELAGESAKKIERYLEVRLGKSVGHITERPDYQGLQHYYQNHFSKRIKSEEPHEAGDPGLNNIDAVRRDQDYELFYIRHEDGTPYFKEDLMRHVRLSCDFDSDAETFEEDPLLQVRAMRDRDLQASAGQILADCHDAIGDLYKLMRKLGEHQLAQTLNLSVMGLLLAANPRNLLQNTSGKTALQYFEDFHRFLRRAYKTAEYQKLIAYPPDKSDKISHALLNLTHALSSSLFHRLGGIKQESIGIIHRTMRRGTETGKAVVKKGEAIWSSLLADDENFRALLAKFPNGPLFKILDLIRAEREEDEIIPFDPVGQENIPSKLYEIDLKEHPIEVIRLPSPTRQALINKVEIIDEFRGMLRHYNIQSPVNTHLLINFQDRTAWKEYTRSRILESLQKNAEFNKALIVVTLPKNTDFYYQNNEHINVNKAEDFLTSFRQQLASAEECGFFFPPAVKPAELLRFADSALQLIHRTFFENKSSLTRKNREDFIEIFYHFLTLKLIDQLKPESLSFTCKDAVDTGAAFSGSFYAFLKLLDHDFSKKEDQDYFRWILYTPALYIRERAVDPERLNRALSALERVEHGLSGHDKEIQKFLAEHLHSKIHRVRG